jgi:hypothetical protein
MARIRTNAFRKAPQEHVMRHDFDHPNSLTIALSTCAAFALAMTARAKQFVRSITGPAANAQFRKAGIEIPDQNSDGFGDLSRLQ